METELWRPWQFALALEWMDHPQPYSDTDPRAIEVWIDLLRKQSPGEKLKTVLTMADGGHAQLQANLRKRYPDADQQEIFERIAALSVGDEIRGHELKFEPMKESRVSTPSEGFRRLLAAIDRLELQYFVGGSVASSTWGLARFTNDVDLVVEIALDDVDEFSGELTKEEFYADAGMMRDGIRHRRAFNAIYKPCVYKFDMFPLQADRFSRSQLTRRRFAETNVLGEPIECAMAAPEDVILSKLRWFRLGREASENQWNDVRGVVQFCGPRLDLAYLREWAAKLNVAELLDKLLTEKR